MSEEQPPRKKTKWIPIVLGVLVLLAFIAIGAMYATVAWFRQNINVIDSAEATAMQELDAVRARFPGQQPLIQLVDGKPQLMSDAGDRPASTTTLTTLHVMAFDIDEGKLFTLSLPFWLLRMKSGPIELSAYEQGWDDRGLSFRVEEIEKHGPGIIVDATRPGEGRFVVWAE
jgi:hypothetical protein